MQMPGRTFSSGSYRYGFNGKESDDEVSGSGNQYDYGFRIYNPRIGKFLSVDPLAASYPWNSTYAFAENRVVDGIDIDGLEYLRANVARIEAVNGRIKLKISNLNFITRNAWYRANENSDNWNPGNLGIDRTVAMIIYNNPISATASMVNLPYNVKKAIAARLSDKVTDPSYLASRHKVINPTTKKGIPDKRYRVKRSVSGASGMSKVASIGTLALNVVNWGLANAPGIAALYEKSLINEQLKEALPQAMADVQSALDAGIIPEKYQNTKDLTNILNVVLQGENTTDNPDIYDIGINIVKKISGNYLEPYSESKDDVSVRQDNTRVVLPIIIK
jgi:RHS repeat-associated protein